MFGRPPPPSSPTPSPSSYPPTTAPTGYGPPSGYPPQQSGYPQPPYPGAAAPPPGYPAPQGYPAAPQGYPAAPQGYPAAPQGYPSPAGYPPAQSGPGFNPGAPAGGSYGPPPPQGYPGAQQGGYAYGGPGQGYPSGGYPPAYSAPSVSGFTPSQQQLNGFGGQYYSLLDPAKICELRGWFNGIDNDKSGQISAAELAKAQFAGRTLTLATATQLMKVFDTDGSGHLGFFEFAALHQFVTSVISAFYMFDHDGSSKLSLKEVQQALAQTGFQFMDHTIEALYKRYQPAAGFGTASQLGLEEYLKLTAFLGQIRSTFFGQDHDHDGLVQFNLESLVQLVSRLN